MGDEMNSATAYGSKSIAAEAAPTGGYRAPGYSPMVSNDALPPAAVVLMVSVRSPAKRSR